MCPYALPVSDNKVMVAFARGSHCYLNHGATGGQTSHLLLYLLVNFPSSPTCSFTLSFLYPLHSFITYLFIHWSAREGPQGSHPASPDLSCLHTEGGQEGVAVARSGRCKSQIFTWKLSFFSKFERVD